MGAGVGEGARVSDFFFFTENQNLKTKKFFFFGGWWGGRVGVGRVKGMG